MNYLAVNLDKELASNRKGVYTFQVQGQVYQVLPRLVPYNDKPSYFQLYFHDTDNEVQNRMKIMEQGSLSEALVKNIMKILEGNPYVKFFKSLQDMSSIHYVQLHISKDVNLDQRLYNCPTSDQVAAIWVEGYNLNVPIERDIIIHSHSGYNHKLKHYYGCYDPLQYPLLFPFGEAGWHRNIPKTNPKGGSSTSKETCYQGIICLTK
ncbi:hypothetical protein LIER_24735 [Lithospermum erythrorhizon]|uniref:Helitron helicase-like domain-containing protein n=1 Tax=Lithospermum erythrorhizon TaxID=34254 RepID=A0AAV3R3Q3_LITER